MASLFHKSTVQLLSLTIIICIVQAGPVREKRSGCREGFVALTGDCVPIHTVKALRELLCQLSSSLSSDNPLSGLSSFCPDKHIEDERRVWGDKDLRSLGEEENDKTIWGNKGFRIQDDEKRAWWHSGLKPDKR